MTETLISEVEILPRTASFTTRMARMIGHAAFEKKSNGSLAGYSPLQKSFRDEMAQLNREFMALDQAMKGGGGVSEVESGIWDHMAGWHTIFGQSDQLDDLMVLLLVTREARLAGELKVLPVKELMECSYRMAFEPHTPALRMELSRKLRLAKVDLNRGFDFAA
jgi:hypothetical protein